MTIEQVMVIGAGQMGAGIAQVCAVAGYSVFLHDTNQESLDRGYQRIEGNLKKQVDKGRLTLEQMEGALNKLIPTCRLDVAGEVDLVIEAIIENMVVKKELFKELERVVKPSTILASNTSSLPITEIAAVTDNPERVIGMHFMNPVPVMKLVEIIRGLATSDEVFSQVEEVTKRLGKVAVEVNDFPGFVSNRILMPMINEAIFTVYEGVATPRAVDEVMMLGMNHPMGPLTLADFIGLDTCLSIMETLHDGFGDDKYRPCPLLRKYVSAGWLGKKSGRGFYQYD
ncbi:3-hydroxybutyryl-CoA dehydrogenase [Litchfieldia salsa]|uniref:3-hydroxybutyryl-CoA dehydrogenase n=1 Tax=Litchfieldia salsa TaxID=930152 RepID=A0A1H0U6G3_9BACI|nr:3-hydroxybutyryl-CoA dehydrogenase [Litchfieldia salsa]SDP61568.1 3-hydroxybutyryl-CoA dehydrogenase [Litchfieldia salsa]